MNYFNFEATKLSSVIPTLPPVLFEQLGMESILASSAGTLHLVPQANFFLNTAVAQNAGKSCGYVGAALLQTYWDYRSLQESDLAANSAIPGQLLLRDGQQRLHDKILSFGHRESSWAFSIRHAWRKANRSTGRKASLKARLSWIGVYESLKRGEPVLLFGGLPDVSREDHPYINHAVVAYGWMERTSGRSLLVHYGWPDQEAWLLETPFRGSALYYRPYP